MNLPDDVSRVMKNTTVLFYTTLGCHLCEDAMVMLQFWLGQQTDPPPVEAVEIANDPELVTRYGVRIPVVAVGAQEIGCPFGLGGLPAVL